MSDIETRPPLLLARGIVKVFRRRGRRSTALRAVDDVSIEVTEGEILGIVGESGSGKSTLARCIAGLIKLTSGEIEIDGKPTRGRRSAREAMQMVFQDPGSSLDPRLTVGYSVGEPLRVAGVKGWRAKVADMIRDVGLDPNVVDRYPHELSGGQQQRVGIARALISNPRLVIHDEAVSSLDVSLQAQIVNLLLELRASRNATYLFISHDLGVVQTISDRIVVMYRGRIVEQGPSAAIMNQPLHPYTFALVGSVPSLDPVEARRWIQAWLPASVLEQQGTPSGCRFRDRCPLATELCAEQEPLLVEYAPGHRAACHYPGHLRRDRLQLDIMGTS